MDRRGLCSDETVSITANIKAANSGITQTEHGIRTSGGRQMMLVSFPLLLTTAVVAMEEHVLSVMVQLHEADAYPSISTLGDIASLVNAARWGSLSFLASVFVQKRFVASGGHGYYSCYLMCTPRVRNKNSFLTSTLLPQWRAKCRNCARNGIGDVTKTPCRKKQSFRMNHYF